MEKLNLDSLKESELKNASWDVLSVEEMINFLLREEDTFKRDLEISVLELIIFDMDENNVLQIELVESET